MSDFTLSSTMDAFLTEADSLVTPHGIKDINDVLSIDNNTRVLYDYMGNVVMEWAGANLPVYYPFGVVMNDATGVNFANGSRVKEGITDAGEGGSKGVAMVCSLDYEFKWEAGRLYVMGQDGFTIRVEQFGFTDIPDATDDDTKGYIVGSRRILDDGTTYLCTDATTGAAVWSAVYQHYDSSGYSSIDWNNRRLNDTSGNPILEWSNPSQVDMAIGVNLGVDYIYDAGVPTNGISLVDGQLFTYGGSPVPSVDWYNRELVNEAGTSIASWSNIYGLIGLSLGDGQRYIGIDSTLRFFDGSVHVDMVDWSQGLLRKSVGGAAATTVDWNNCYLSDPTSITSLSWLYRELYDSSVNTSINWDTRQLIGTDGTTAALDWATAGTLTVDTNTSIIESTGGSGFGFLNGEVALYNAASGLNLGSYPLKADQITNGAFNGAPSFTYGATLSPAAVASLPATPVEGTISYVNDADTPAIGSAVVAGASAKCLVCYNGTDWIVTSLL